MKTIDIICIALLSLLAATNIATALIFLIWWYIVTGAMFALLASAVYVEAKH